MPEPERERLRAANECMRLQRWTRIKINVQAKLQVKEITDVFVRTKTPAPMGIIYIPRCANNHAGFCTFQ